MQKVVNNPMVSYEDAAMGKKLPCYCRNLFVVVVLCNLSIYVFLRTVEFPK